MRLEARKNKRNMDRVTIERNFNNYDAGLRLKKMIKKRNSQKHDYLNKTIKMKIFLYT